MGRIEELAEAFEKYISAPWQQGLAGAQKTLMLVHDKADERRLLAKKQLFKNATRGARHEWHEFDFTDVFARWMTGDEYREPYFESPDDLVSKADPKSENCLFATHAADNLRAAVTATGVDTNTVLGVFGVASLFGLTRLSHVLRKVEPDILGRLAVFFPGSYDNNNYRLLDARDGFNYLAIPIVAHSGELG